MKTVLHIRLFLFLLILLLDVNHSLAVSQCSFCKTPVEPTVVKGLTIKKNKQAKKNRKIYKIPSERTWGVWSLSIGAYLVVLAVFSALFFIGFYFYLYLLAILLVIFIFGIYLTVNGVSIIDNSYIHYSDNPELNSARVRPGIVRDFVFAGILLTAILGFILIQFYLSAWLCLIAVVAMITFALLKLASLRKSKT